MKLIKLRIKTIFEDKIMTHLSVRRHMEADISSQAVGFASSADFSLMNLFIRADIVVKSVIIF